MACVNSPCVAPLMFKAIQWLSTAQCANRSCAFMQSAGLKRFIANAPQPSSTGWNRCLARGDQAFYQGRVFIRESERQKLRIMPDELKVCPIKVQRCPEDYSVDCSLTMKHSHLCSGLNALVPKAPLAACGAHIHHRIRVRALAVTGTPSTPPTKDVLRNGRPRYDHVLAALAPA